MGVSVGITNTHLVTVGAGWHQQQQQQELYVGIENTHLVTVGAGRH